VPVLESALTQIADGRLTYRGQDATKLARSHSFEEVAALLWGGTLLITSDRMVEDSDISQQLDIIEPERLEPVARMQVLLPLIGAGDVAAYDLRSEAVMRAGWRWLRLFVRVAGADVATEDTIAGQLAHGWGSDAADAERLLNAALILCADHELNVSSFTVRCIASARAPLYAALSGGLSALLGTKHGGSSLAVEALLDEAELRGPAVAVGNYLRRGAALPGFGHRLYPPPLGDPRASCLLDLLAAADPDASAIELGRATVDAVASAIDEGPNVELALVVLARWLGRPPGTALTLLALGRTAGWVAHALEEYARDQLIRPRAKYVGVTGDG
jgi:citrate synthase